MTTRPKSMKRTLLLGFFLGLAAGIPALLLAAFSTGAGHGTYLWAFVLFPCTMALAVLDSHIGTVAIILALLQMPLYGMWVAFFLGGEGPRRRLVWLPLLLHLLAWGLASPGRSF
jgi:hypothetical protein